MSKRLTRRSFLETIVISAGAATLGPSVLSACGSSRPLADVFPQSIASGDPRETSIVLWTRAVPEGGTGAARVKLELSTDPELSSRFDLGGLAELDASPDHDHCLRVKVTGLEPGTNYFYRFEHEGTKSRTGRFRTAERADANIPVRFAVMSCQDYVGRYYNPLLRLLDGEHDDLTFVLHLGDYVYETTGDPGFMMSTAERNVTFRAPDEALSLGSGDSSYQAARSLSNYRDLYRAYRSDPKLQEVHEKFPFVCIWDDHEFSDDCWGDHATYSDGQAVEEDMDRRRASEQAWLEYMPVAMDVEADGDLVVDPANLYPNAQIYRSFRFGQHCSLAVTDYRSKRPDHPTPEDAYPGAVILDEAQTRAALAAQEAAGELPAGTTADAAFAEGRFRSYVDLEDAAFADHKRALEILLTAAYGAEGVEAARAAELAATYAQGKTDAALLQARISEGRASLPADLMGVTDVDPTDATLPLGLPYFLLGKTSLVGQLGARYLTVQRTYDLVQVWRTRVGTDATHDDVFGAAQQSWLTSALSGADTTWSFVGNSVQSTSMVLDLSPFDGSLPEGLPPERFYLNVDQWDGFPERRRQLLENAYRPNNVIVLAGDIHGAYASDLGADADGNRCIELTTPAISSETFRGLLYRTGNGNASIRDSGLLDPVVDAIDSFMMSAFEPLELAESDKNGVLVIYADATELNATWHLLASGLVSRSFYDDPGALSDQWEISRWRVAKAAGKNSPLGAA
ncbi:MAG: alkaline phosphatase D family protein [Sandaracinaceae bacterium]|nr:alkaline phosphatase D family protein [Sandaracinaceae bacterium]